MTPTESHIVWVADRIGRELTQIERELVTIVCVALRTGPWNIHRDWTIMRSEHGYASISTGHDLATYDTDALTRLVFAAHDRCCRVEVVPSGPGRLAIAVCPRGRGGDFLRRHPTIEAALATWRAQHPEEEP